MDLKRHIIIINKEDKTFQVESIECQGNKYAIRFSNSPIVYAYNRDKVLWLNNPSIIDPENAHVYVNGVRTSGIREIGMFARYGYKYYAITYDNDFTRHYPSDEIEIRLSCLVGGSLSIFNYLKACAGINTLGASDNDDDKNEGLLSAIYSRIDFIDDITAAAPYLDRAQKINRRSINPPIFPFGCNSSQIKAVKNALLSQLSVIQGPPGTGKTQTILNIIANLVIAGKSVLIVSNNNSATDNILEKLTKNELDLLVAPLGRKENKEAFIANQSPIVHKLPFWEIPKSELKHIAEDVKKVLWKLESVFAMQERLAEARQELSEIETEQLHFIQENSVEDTYSTTGMNSFEILQVIDGLKGQSDCREENNGLWKYICNTFKRIVLKFKMRYKLNLKKEITSDNLSSVITNVEATYYKCRIAELKNEISNLEEKLSNLDVSELTKTLTGGSLKVLKGNIAKQFDRERLKVASVSELYHNGSQFLKDYPVVLSTTFSARLCFDSDTLFDYVIMDEASQVGVETGLLALSCARNAVIVGDTMQLPNVITEDDRLKLEELKKMSGVPDMYDTSHHSFLSSILAIRTDIPETLLREHYRCHPDIINFCNQKFYGGNLLIMTKREANDRPLLAITTSEGHHCRGHYNQREIDTIKEELLPLLSDIDPAEIGIITPYRNQAEQFHAQLPQIEADTVHKYQGREKDTIIMSVTDDKITEFSDNANLLNVAVSRAKQKFCLVVSGNPQELKGNIHDLLGYIQYQYGAVIKSNLRSIYDYLYTQMSNRHRNLMQISEYESENLTYELIDRIRRSVPQLSHIKVLFHYPLHSLISDYSILSEDEQKYASHPSTHIDFLIINRVSKEPLLAIETDGYNYHNDNTEQSQRDRMKDRILEQFKLPILRLSTISHSEEQRIINALLHDLSA